MNTLVDEHQTRIVLKGWLKGLISICLLGAPVALGYLGIQLALVHNGQAYSQETQTLQQLRELGESIAQVKRQSIDNKHGNVYSRYTDAERMQADVDELIREGRNLVLIGSTGRSTSPQAHLSVYKHGRPVDPATYIHRTAG